MNWQFTITCNNDLLWITLEDEPIDWESYELTIRRDPKLHGKIFSMGNELTFYGDGYSFIKDKYDYYGIAADLVIDIYIVCQGSVQSLPQARINMSSLDFEEGQGCYVTANLEEASCVMQFKNRADLKVDIFSLDTVDDPGVDSLLDYDLLKSEITLTPKLILKTLEYLYNEDPEVVTVNAQQVGAAPGALQFDFFIYMKPGDIIEELQDTNDDFTNGDTDTEIDVPHLFTVKNVATGWNIEIVYEADLDVTVFLDNLTMDDCAFPNKFEEVTVALLLRRRRGGLDLIHTVGTQTFSGCAVGLAEHLSFAYNADFPWPVTLDDEISLYLQVGVSGDYSLDVLFDPATITVNVDVTDTAESFIKVTLTTTFPETECLVGFPNEALSRIAEKLTGGCLRVYSQYFGHGDAEPYSKFQPGDPSDETGCGAFQSVTTGALIRKLEDAKGFMSWNDLYNGLSNINCLGMGIEDDPYVDRGDRIRVEKATFFYQDDVIDLLVDHPTKIHRTIKTDIFFTKLTVGYATWEAEEYNGLDEFNTKRVYTSKLNQIQGEKTIVSSLVASGYAIEVTRQQGNTTKDWRFDNNPFVIVTNEARTENEHGNIVSAANIVDPPSVYNFRISPVRNLIRWFEFLFSMFKDYLDTDQAKLLFSSGEGNYIAEGLITGGCVPESDVLSESQDLVYEDKSDFATEIPRLGWEEWSFDYPVNFEEYIELKENFYKRISVRWEDGPYNQAYITEMNYRPSKGIASFKCIRAVAFDATPGIDILLQESGFALLQESGDYILLP